MPRIMPLKLKILTTDLPENHDLPSTVFSSISNIQQPTQPHLDDAVRQSSIITDGEVALLVKENIDIESYIGNPTWKTKTGFTIDNNGNNVSCSVFFDTVIESNDELFRKIYKYDCKVSSFVTNKIYAEIFFQKKAYELLNIDKLRETSVVKNVNIPRISKYGKLNVPGDNSIKPVCYFYIDMEHVAYPTLYKIKKGAEKQGMQFTECNDVDNIVGDVDDFLQTHGIIHNDLKPDNILVDTDANPMNIYIIDFGEATKTNTGRSGTGASTPISVCGGKARHSSKSNKINRQKLTKKHKHRSRRDARKSAHKRRARSARSEH